MNFLHCCGNLCNSVAIRVRLTGQHSPDAPSGKQYGDLGASLAPCRLRGACDTTIMTDEKPAALTDEEIAIVLRRLPGWAVENSQLSKEFLFKDFVDSLGFVNRLVPFFESKDHHPDIHIFYNRVRFDLSRHDIGGKVTSLDGEVAKHIEHEYSTMKN